MQQQDGKMNPTEAETLSQLLDIQLAEKRLQWQRKTSRYRSFRSLGFVFLFLVIAGAALAFFLAYSRMSEERPVHPVSTTSVAPKH